MFRDASWKEFKIKKSKQKPREEEACDDRLESTSHHSASEDDEAHETGPFEVKNWERSRNIFGWSHGLSFLRNP